MRYPILACAAGLGLLALLGGPDPAAADEVNAEGVAKGSIALGTSTPLTGPVGPPCRPISDASSAWFKHVNEAGGVNGRTIDYTVLDDAYKAPEALANGRELARKPVFALFAGCGTLQPPVLLPIAKSNGLLYLFPFAGNPELMTTDFVYNLFPLYGEQYAGLVSSALKLNGAGSLIYVVADVPGESLGLMLHRRPVRRQRGRAHDGDVVVRKLHQAAVVRGRRQIASVGAAAARQGGRDDVLVGRQQARLLVDQFTDQVRRAQQRVIVVAAHDVSVVVRKDELAATEEVDVPLEEGPVDVALVQVIDLQLDHGAAGHLEAVGAPVRIKPGTRALEVCPRHLCGD